MLMLFAFEAEARSYSVGGEEGGCPYHTRHVPNEDVAYQPGVDAEGWAVAPAETDMPPLASSAFDEVTLDLDLPAADFTDIPALNQRFPFAEIDAGEVTIRQDGSGTLNDQPFGQSHGLLHPDCP